MLRFVPKANRLFREKLLKPWRAMALSNLVVIRKTAPNQRHRRYHQPF
jgi:hypothetical protein